MSLRAAVDMDAADSASTGGSGGEALPVNGASAGKAAAAASPYLSPAMRFDGSDLAPLREEAAAVASYLAGTKPPPPVEDMVAEEAAREAVAAKQHTLRAETRRSPARFGRGASVRKGADAAPAGAAAAAPMPAVAKAKSGRKAANAAPAVAAPAVPADTPTAPNNGPATTYEEAIRRANSGRAPSGEV